MESALQIAILGWGSLVWNPGDLPITSGWSEGGPVLPIEFSRVSTDGRLTLVIDPEHGTPVPTRYAQSARAELDAAIADLRHRESTVEKYIGFLDLVRGSSRCRHEQTLDMIRPWARSHGFDAVVWTDLPGNFEEMTGSAFSAESALRYLHHLTSDRAAAAREYVDRAPAEVDTPVRRLATTFRQKAADSRSLVSTGPSDIADDSWLAIQREIDACETCRKDDWFVPKLPLQSRPWDPVKKGRLLLMSEAPPEHGGFWHLPGDGDLREEDDLRDQIFRLLEPHGLALRSGPHGLEAFRSFMSAGLFLVQTLKWPLAKRAGKKGRSFNHLPSDAKTRLVEHAVTAHLRAELSAVAPAGILAMGNAALAACRLLSQNPAGITRGGVTAVRKNNQRGLEMTFDGRQVPLDVTLLAVDQNMRAPESARLVEEDLRSFLSRHRWTAHGGSWAT